LFQAVEDRGLSSLGRLRVAAETELVAARNEQARNLEGELGGIARPELAQRDAGRDEVSSRRSQSFIVASTASRTGPLREAYSGKTVTQKSPPCSPVCAL
jgi:hypothetical protein